MSKKAVSYSLIKEAAAYKGRNNLQKIKKDLCFQEEF